ncbi:HesA/MoeB/ThiF family protein [Vibrio sp. MA40-2]|uniref:HesA/MoeB/ThiF family protein n=1 Tax=Vibrio sp. MA40-2 TaxID=3391828 RepID=UPI0039A438DB
MLNDFEFLRYSRQISVAQIGLGGQEKLKHSRVLIVGCGGLGNVVALYLAASGIGKLVLSDGDKVESSNLQRQIAYSEHEIGNSKANSLCKKIVALNSSCNAVAIDQNLFGERLQLETMISDLVIDCTDNFRTRKEINQACVLHRTPLVSGSVINWQGQVAIFNNHRDAPCYECLFPSTEEQSNVNCSSLGVVGPIVGVIGSMQALLSIRLIANVDSTTQNELHCFDGLDMKWNKFVMQRNIDCVVCMDKEF